MQDLSCVHLKNDKLVAKLTREDEFRTAVLGSMLVDKVKTPRLLPLHYRREVQQYAGDCAPAALLTQSLLVKTPRLFMARKNGTCVSPNHGTKPRLNGPESPWKAGSKVAEFSLAQAASLGATTVSQALKYGSSSSQDHSAEPLSLAMPEIGYLC